MWRIAVLYVLVLSFGCRRKLPIGIDDVPKFYFEGTVNNQPIKWEAGNDSMFMQTNYFVRNNVLTVEGNLAADNLNNIRFLKLQIANSNNNIDAFDFNALFAPQNFYSYSIDSLYTIFSPAKLASFTFTGKDSAATSYTWQLDTNLVSTQKNPYILYTTDGAKQVSLIVKHKNGVEDFLVNTLPINFNNNFNGQFTVDRTNPDDLQISTTASGAQWIMPDGTLKSGNIINYNKVITQRGYITLNATINGNPFTYKQCVTPKYSNVLINFNYKTKDTTLTATQTGANNFSKAIISLGLNGKTYLSYKNTPLLKQNSKIIFNLISAEPYTQNASGQNTYALTGSVDGFLFNKDNINDSVAIKSNRLRLAVAYK